MSVFRGLEQVKEHLRREREENRANRDKRKIELLEIKTQLERQSSEIKEKEKDRLVSVQQPKTKLTKEEEQRLNNDLMSIDAELEECKKKITYIAHEQKVERDAESQAWGNTRQRGHMPNPEYKTIQANFADLTDIIINPIALLNNLYAKNVFDRQNIEKIQKEYKENGSLDATRLILLTLLDCGVGSFDKFLDSLTPECCEFSGYPSAEKRQAIAEKKDDNFLDVFQEEENEEAEYIGRQGLREAIVNKLSGESGLAKGNKPGRLIHLHGEPKVGKKRLAGRALLDFKERHPDVNIKAIHVSCQHLENWQDFLNRFTQNCIGKKDEMTEDNILNEIRDAFKDSKTILLITNCEIMEDNSAEFESFVSNILKRCLAVAIIITSRVPYHLTEKFLVEPLTDEDTVALLESELLDIKSEPYKAVVIKHCKGLPAYILDAAAFIKNYNHLGITSDELEKYLQSDDHRRRVCVTDIRSKHDDKTMKVAADLMIFPGSFGKKAFLAVGSDHDLLNLSRKSIIKATKGSDSTIRLEMTKFFYDFMLVRGGTYSDPARLRFVKYFGHILEHANNILYTESYDTVFGYLKEDWVNVEHALKEAIHRTDAVYSSFKEVGVVAEDLIVNCFPALAVTFYEKMTEISDNLGHQEDKAVFTCRLARAVSLANGDEMDKACRLFEESLSFLKGQGASVHLITNLQFYGYTLYKREKIAESMSCFTMAVEAAKKLEKSPRVMKHLISLGSLISIICMASGKYERAKSVIDETMKMASVDFPLHPSLPVMINSLGIIYEHDDDLDNAMKRYKHSLAERRKAAKLFPLNLVIPLNRISNLLMEQNKYKEALPYLKEAYEIRRSNFKMDTDMALTLKNMGRAYLMLQNYPEAIDHLEESLHIYDKCTPNSSAHIDIQLTLAHCHILNSCVPNARTCLESAINHGKTHKELFSKDVSLCSTIGHLLMLVQFEKDIVKESLKDFRVELMRCKDRQDGERPEVETLYTGSKSCLDEFDREKPPDFQFLKNVHCLCEVCKRIDENGQLRSEDAWKSATEKANSEVERWRRLTSSDILTAALSE